jgi:pilus assembly protein FimV
VDNGEVSIQGDFSDVGMLTTEEKVDPVAEADVLMAYGRDQQAEEILLEGLRQDSGRTAIHMKLLDLYAKQENIAEFETIANALHKLNGGRGADWEKTQVMAQNLGLAGGIFLGAASPATLDQTQPAAVEALDAGTSAPEAGLPKDEDVGSLDFDLDLGTTNGGPAAAVEAEPVAAAAAEPSEEAPAPEQAMSLDFDFDLGTPESAAPQAQQEPAQASGNTVADDGSIDFELDLGSDANVTTEAAAENVASVEPEPVESEAAGLAMDAVELDFDLDLGSAPDANEAPDVAALAVPAEAVGTAVAPLELPAVPAHDDVAAEAPGDLKLDFDLELDAEPAPVASAPVADVPAPLDLADISLDLDDVEPVAPSAVPSQPDVRETAPEEAASADVDFEMDFGDAEAEVAPTEVAHEKPVAATVDLPGIDLSTATGEMATPAAEVMATAESAGLLLEDGHVEIAPVMEPDNPEVTTKFELAQAYEEMGDQEGARDLLNEVLNEGSAAQQAQARMRLDQLGI